MRCDPLFVLIWRQRPAFHLCKNIKRYVNKRFHLASLMKIKRGEQISNIGLWKLVSTNKICLWCGRSLCYWRKRRSVHANRGLRRISGHKREEVTEEWRKLHKNELQDWVLARFYIYRWSSKADEIGIASSTYGRDKPTTENSGRKTCREEVNEET